MQSQKRIETSLRNMTKQLEVDMDEIKTQMDLVQLRRTFILSIFAGLYIPLSFVTVSFVNQSACGYNKH